MTASGDVPRAAWGAALADLALVAAFALAGRSSHGRDVLSLGYLETVWPFAAGAALGWLLTRAWQRPLSPTRAGVGVWLSTVAGGMVLRAVSGQGTAVAFVVVTTVVLGLALVGWRLVASRATRSRVMS